ncbi:zinc-finger-containing protein [Halovulum sp. GXIMD14793]
MGKHGDCIWCCSCGEFIAARLTNGSEVYPHRADLSKLPFWICDGCGNHVGCHHKTQDPTRPLGVIATKEIKTARSNTHRILDPIWKSGRMRRGAVYAWLRESLGKDAYHTANITSLEEARETYRAVLSLRQSLGMTEI